MKTKYLDSELQRLSILEKQGALSVFGRETLIEFKAIKQALTIPDVMGMFNEGFTINIKPHPYLQKRGEATLLVHPDDMPEINYP